MLRSFISKLAMAIPLLLVAGSGCAVPQPRGEGMYQYIKEPTKEGWYHLYLPADYVKNNGRHPDHPQTKRWPLVMTFHGMRPYDTAKPQEREWEQEADTYGYIVCAPVLDTSDSFMEYPLTKEHSYVLRDRDRVLAIMDHVFSTTLADPDRVLSTSWSCGGYLAHYFVNRYPEKFACLATRLSNFSGKLLLEETVPRYRDRIPIGIFAGDSDFPACKKESEMAVAWYTARNFRIVRGKMVDRIGHERIPQTAAAFFAEQMGIKPLHPLEAAKTVGEIQMTDYYPPPELIAEMSPSLDVRSMLASGETHRGDTGSSRTITPESKPETPYVNMSAGRDYPYERLSEYDPNPKSTSERGQVASVDQDRGNWLAPTEGKPRTSGADSKASRSIGDTRVAGSTGRGDERAYEPKSAGSREYDTWASRDTRPSSKSPAAPEGRLSDRSASANTTPAAQSVPTRARTVNIRFSGPAVGTSPHYLQYSVDLPPDMTRGADFLWKDNGVWMGDQASGSKVLTSPGLHRISVLLVSKDNVEYRGMATVHVLEPGPSLSQSKSGDTY